MKNIKFGSYASLLDPFYIRKDGGNSPASNIDWGAYKIINLANPENDQDAATKYYVDQVITGKQDALTAGTNIDITNNIISATDTTYSSSDFDLASLGDVDDTDKAEGKILQVDSLGKHIYVTNAGGSDEKVKYDSNDTTAGYLSEKILAGTGISLSEGTGTDENKLIITNTGGGSTYTAGSGIDITENVISNTGVITESDPVFTSSQASNITQTDITNLSNLSGSNSGDQESSDFSLEDLSDVVKTAKATGKILQVNSSGTHEYVDLPNPDVSALVPYTGATTDVDLGAYDLTVTDITAEGNLKILNEKFIQGRNYVDSAEVDILKVNTDDEVEAGANFVFGMLEFSSAIEPISPSQESTFMYQEATGVRPNRTISLLTKNELGEKVIISTTIV